MELHLSSLIHAQYRKKPVVAVAAAQDEHVLAALRQAVDLGLADALLIGDGEEIRASAARAGVALSGMEIMPCADPVVCCAEAVRLVREGVAHAVMKGIVPTAATLRAVLNSDTGLKQSELLSYVSVFELPGIDRLIYVSDSALNMYPDVQAKKHIIQNAVSVAAALGNPCPVVACLCAVENVNPKMPPTLDAAALVEMNRAGEITNCVVTGPLALDNCLYREAALHKGIKDPNAGRTDILLAPEIETGNALHKAFSIVMQAPAAGVLVGASAPVIVTSRVDSEQTKLHSIALAMRMAYERMA